VAQPPAEVSAMRISLLRDFSLSQISVTKELLTLEVQCFGNFAKSAAISSLTKQDLVDTFDLFKTYLDHKLHDLKSDIISEQENLSLNVKEQVNLKFKSEGNKIQF
jgi:hypothetical protein